MAPCTAGRGGRLALNRAVGKVRADRAGISVGMAGPGAPLKEGTTLVLDRGASAEVGWRDMSRLSLHGPCRVTLEGRGVKLESGRIYCVIDPVHQGFRVLTPGCEVTVVGARFEVVSGAGETSVRVHEGRVTVRELAGGLATLSTGQEGRWP